MSTLSKLVKEGFDLQIRIFCNTLDQPILEVRLEKKGKCGILQTQIDEQLKNIDIINESIQLIKEQFSAEKDLCNAGT